MNTAVMPTYARTDFAFERGEGVRLITAEGDEYLDFGSGIAVNSLGHCHPRLVARLQEQAEKVWRAAHESFRHAEQAVMQIQNKRILLSTLK